MDCVGGEIQGPFYHFKLEYDSSLKMAVKIRRRNGFLDALCRAGEARESRLMVHSCQSGCPELLFYSSFLFFLNQRAFTLSCSESVKKKRLKGALWHFGNNMVIQMLLYQAPGGLVSLSDDPKSSVVYSSVWFSSYFYQ